MSEILSEAQRLWALGGAIHWLKPKSKMPVESGWTTGPRKPWEYLEDTYIEGANVGVRLGAASKCAQGFWAVIDIDIKSKDPRHKEEALKAARKILGVGVRPPCVASGRGNGSRHYYCVTARPFKTFNFAESTEMVRVHMPSKAPSKKEREELTEKELAAGIRISKAWEVSLYSEGRQVVLPPSIHPDSGEAYRWRRPLIKKEDLPILDIDKIAPSPRVPAAAATVGATPKSASGPALFDFSPVDVDLGWAPISDDVLEIITKGSGVVDRSAYLMRAASALLSAGLSRDEILSVLTDPNLFLGEVGYDHAKTENRNVAAAWVYKYTLGRLEIERDPVLKFTPWSPDSELPPLDAAAAAAQTLWILEDSDWTRNLERSGPKGSGPYKSTIGNVTLILTNEVAEDLVKRDTFAWRDIYTIDTPWGAKAGEVVADDHVTKIRHWLGRTWGFEPKKDTTSDALTVIAMDGEFDPVREKLDGLPPWDGTPRLNGWLSENFEAKGDPDYLAQVFRKWILAMVVRVYRPGAKFDWMPIFEGEQGVGKSSFGRLLVGDQYFLDWLPNLHDKDAALGLQGMWAVEMGELSQFRKNELETIKAFITRTVDKVRPPYGRRMIESPRRCVFFGTTNRSEYLSDDTGNRRFKPVKVGRLDFKALKRDREQLFAEAKWIFENGKKEDLILDLTGSAVAAEKLVHQEKRVQDDSDIMADLIIAFFERVLKEEAIFSIEKFKTIDLFLGKNLGAHAAPLGAPFRPVDRNFKSAARALRKLGFQQDPGHHRFWRPKYRSKFWRAPFGAPEGV